MNGSDYYNKTITIAHVDRNDNVLGKIERWEAHEKGILHRAITVGLLYEGRLVLQHRKHPVFDKWFDLTASSHPIYYDDGTIQTNEDSVYKTLEREWGVKSENVKGLHSPGHVVYKSPDKNSKYIEHEVCHLFIGSVDNLPDFNEDVSYGLTLISPEELKDTKSVFYPVLASWVKEFITKKLI